MTHATYRHVAGCGARSCGSRPAGPYPVIGRGRSLAGLPKKYALLGRDGWTRFWDEPRSYGRASEEVIVAADKVRKSTHGAASACLPVPVSASRCLGGVEVVIDALHPVSGSYSRESGVDGHPPVSGKALLRNEVVSSSDPCVSRGDRIDHDRRVALLTAT